LHHVNKSWTSEVIYWLGAPGT